MANLEHLIERHPRLYHMAEAESWENVRRRGLLSTRALLDLFAVDKPRRTQIETQYRSDDEVICHPEHGQATIRRHSPRLKPGHLQNVLPDNVQPSEWYRLLNGKVFFWSNRDRLNNFLKAEAHRDRHHDVLTVCTRSLVAQYDGQITLSHMNSGEVRRDTHKRDQNTFKTIDNYRCSKRKYRNTCECFAELTVEGRVLDIEQHVLSVDRWTGANRLENIWHR